MGEHQCNYLMTHVCHVTSDPSLCVLQRLDDDGEDEAEPRPLAESLLLAVSDLLFCPDFTVQQEKKSKSVSVMFHFTTRAGVAN